MRARRAIVVVAALRELPTRRAPILAAKEAVRGSSKRSQTDRGNDPTTTGRKIAGFAEFNLKQYEAATADLQRALDLQRAAKQEDANTVDALAQAYVLTEKFDRALPLLVTATTRKGGTPDAVMLYYRGIAEYRTAKLRCGVNSTGVKANPKCARSNTGQLLTRAKKGAAVSALTASRAMAARPAWALLTSAYLRRAAGVAGREG